MTGEVILSNPAHTVSFMYFENFEGVKTDIDPQYLEDALKSLKVFRDNWDASERITVGIETAGEGQPGTVVFFLDKKQKSGIAIAPMIDNEGAPDE